MKQLLEEVLYALEYASDMTKPDGLAGCDCPVCSVIPKVKAKLKELNEPASFKWYDGKGVPKASSNGNVPLGGSQVVYDCSEPIRMDWEKRAKDASVAAIAEALEVDRLKEGVDHWKTKYSRAMEVNVQLRGKLAERGPEYLAAHITYDKGYQEGRQDAQDAHADALADAEIASHAKRLALELECLLLSTKDTAAVTKWWDTAHEALQAYHDACREVYK